MTEYGSHPITMDGKEYFLQFTARDIVTLEEILHVGLPVLFRKETKGIKIGSALLWAGLKQKDEKGRLVPVFQTLDMLGGVVIHSFYPIGGGSFIDSINGMKEAADMLMRYTQEKGNSGIYGLFEEFAQGFIASGWFKVPEEKPTTAQEEPAEAS